MTRFWLGLLIGIALGLLASQFVAPRENPVNEGSGIALEGGKSPDTSERSSSLLETDRTLEVVDSQAHLARTEGDPVQAFLRSLPRPEEMSGSGTITGTILTTAGRPLADVTVRATPRGSPTRSSSDEGSLATYVDSLARGEAWRRANRRVVTSDALGNFTIGNLDDSTDFQVAFEREGYHFEGRSPNVRFHSVRPGRQLDIVAEPVVSVTFDVRMPDGTQAPRSTLDLASGGSSESHGWRPDAPTLSKASGTYRVQARSGEGRYASERKAVTFGDDSPPVTLLLERVPLITGRVKTVRALQSSSFRVHLHPWMEGGEPSPEVVRDRGEPTWAHEYDGFAFEFSHKPAGRYGMVVSSGDRVLSDLVPIDFDGEFLDVTLEVRPPRREDFVSVLVLDPAGERIHDASITSGVRGESGYGSGSGLTIPQPDGRVWVSHHEPDGQRGELTYFVQVQCHLGRLEATYVRTMASEVTVRFGAPATLEVTITGTDDPALLGQIEVRVEDSESNRHVYREGETLRGATHVMTGLQPGPHAVVLSLRTDRHRSMELVRQSIILASGSNATTVTLPPLHRVGVVFPDGQPGTTVRLRADDDRGWSSSQEGTLDGNRHAYFDLVPAGRYRISSSGAGEMDIEVTGSMEITFQKTEKNALRVRSVHAGSYAEQVGFRKGDLLIAVDGQEFENELQMRTLVMGAMGKEESTFLVLRDGSRVPLVVDMKKLMTEESRGLDMRPASR